VLFEAYNAAISEAARRETEASGVLPQESAQSSICGSPGIASEQLERTIEIIELVPGGDV